MDPRPNRVRSRKERGKTLWVVEEGDVAKDHGPSVKNDKQYEGLRKKGMSKQTRSQDRQHAQRVEEGR